MAADVAVRTCRNVEFKQTTNNIEISQSSFNCSLNNLLLCKNIVYAGYLFENESIFKNISFIKIILKVTCNSRRKQAIPILKNTEHLVRRRWVRGLSIILRSNSQGHLLTPLLINNYVFILSHNHLFRCRPRAIEQKEHTKFPRVT